MKKPGRTRKNEPSTKEDREEDEGKSRQEVASDLGISPPGIERFRPPPKKWGAWGELNFCG